MPRLKKKKREKILSERWSRKSSCLAARCCRRLTTAWGGSRRRRPSRPVREEPRPPRTCPARPRVRPRSQQVHPGSCALLPGVLADFARKRGRPGPAPPGGRTVAPPPGNSWQQRTPASGWSLWNRSWVWAAQQGRDRLVWRCWFRCSTGRRCTGRRIGWRTPSLSWTRGTRHSVLKAHDRPINAGLWNAWENGVGKGHQTLGLR